MIDIAHLKTIMQIHGISKDTTDDLIRNTLLSYSYTEPQIIEAINTIRKETSQKNVINHGLNKLFRSDEVLTSAEVSSLLGIDITILEVAVRESRNPTVPTIHYVIVFVMALLLAASSVIYTMYAQESGPFHPHIATTQP
jgi:hypothetical protein